MRFPGWFALAMLLIPMSDLHAEPGPDRADPSALIDELSSDDFKARRAAADRILKAGYLTVERVARQSTSLDAESWQAFADAFIRKDWTPYATALVAAAHAAPEAHRRRLIDLARRLVPMAGRTPTPQEIETIVRRELVEKRGTIADFFWEGAIALFGHAGVPATLTLLRKGDPDTVDYARASLVLEVMAQPEDIPALRTLLLEGKSSVAAALGRLGALGFTEASNVLIEAVRSGQFDPRIAFTLGQMSNRRQAAEAVREWVAGRGRSLTDDDRAEVAKVCAALESRTDVSTLEAWSSLSRDSTTLLELGKALTRLGSPKGIQMLVQIVEEKRVEPLPQQGAADAGRLSAEGFEGWQRRVALRTLDAVAAQLWDGPDCNRPEQGPWKGSRHRDLDRVAAAVREWWEASRNEMEFDGKSGEWRLKSN